MKWFNLIMVFVWLALTVPTVLWWRDAIMWIAFMSLYANAAGHWSAFQAARAKESADE